MTVSLKKGDTFLLNDADGNALNNVIAGLGWDANLKKEGGFFKRLFSEAPKFDCDATVLVCKDGKVTGLEDVVFYENLKHKSGAVEHTGDNRSGQGDGDDEQIIVHPCDIPAEYDKLVFIVNIFEPEARKQNFGMVTNAFIRFVNADNDTEICRFDLTSDYSNETAMVVNKRLGLLPATGGSGILFYLGIGAAIMALAVGLAMLKRRLNNRA